MSKSSGPPRLDAVAAILLQAEQGSSNDTVSDALLARFMDGELAEGSEEHQRVLLALAEDPVLREIWLAALDLPAQRQRDTLGQIASTLLRPEARTSDISDAELARFMDGGYVEGSAEHQRVLVALAEDPELREIWQRSLETVDAAALSEAHAAPADLASTSAARPIAPPAASPRLVVVGGSEAASKASTPAPKARPVATRARYGFLAMAAGVFGVALLLRPLLSPPEADPGSLIRSAPPTDSSAHAGYSGPVPFGDAAVELLLGQAPAPSPPELTRTLPPPAQAPVGADLLQALYRANAPSSQPSLRGAFAYGALQPARALSLRDASWRDAATELALLSQLPCTAPADCTGAAGLGAWTLVGLAQCAGPQPNFGDAQTLAQRLASAHPTALPPGWPPTLSDAATLCSAATAVSAAIALGDPLDPALRHSVRMVPEPITPAAAPATSATTPNVNGAPRLELRIRDSAPRSDASLRNGDAVELCLSGPGGYATVWSVGPDYIGQLLPNQRIAADRKAIPVTPEAQCYGAAGSGVTFRVRSQGGKFELVMAWSETEADALADNAFFHDAAQGRSTATGAERPAGATRLLSNSHCVEGGDALRPCPPTTLTRIVNGTPAPAEQYPWMLALQINGRQVCGASLIAAGWAVSAAHCFFDKNGAPVPASRYTVRHGSLSRSSGGRVVGVTEALTHPGYGSRDKAVINDIALLRLAETLPIPPAARLLIASEPLQRWLAAPGSSPYAVGWGKLADSDADRGSDTLQHALLPMLDRATCAAKYPGIDAGVLCAGYLDGRADSCQGDSGGPLVVRTGLQSRPWMLAGVVSFGKGCATANYPGAYASVAHFNAWIVETIARVDPAALNPPPGS